MEELVDAVAVQFPCSFHANYAESSITQVRVQILLELVEGVEEQLSYISCKATRSSSTASPLIELLLTKYQSVQG